MGVPGLGLVLYSLGFYYVDLCLVTKKFTQPLSLDTACSVLGVDSVCVWGGGGVSL